ncbi:MAG TPA: Plug domain-containing protein, partial [Flavobacterium sp.]|nr:Plug domain-containing protein [Flavobacterium sp.]
RLIYIDKENDLDVQLVTDKETYQPNEKATINVSSKSKSGIAKAASFSLSVTDTNGIENDGLDSNISSYFLMESNIRGKVYHPAYYFDVTNSKRLEHLDNLLLTQGWRDFVWKTLPKMNDKNNFKVEKGITISGRVKQLFAEKSLMNNNLTLALTSKKNRNIFSTVTDSNGRFQFENLMFSGKTNMYLNTRDEKGKFKGEIVLDSIEQIPIPVAFGRTNSWSDNRIFLIENVHNKFTAFGVKPKNILKEVVVKAKNPPHVLNLYGVPDYSYTLDKEVKEFTNIYDVLEKVPSVFIINGSITIQGEKNEQSGPPLMLIDGYPALPFEFDLISPVDVVKIDVIRGKMLAMLYILEEGNGGGGGAISIITNGKRGNKPKKDPYQSIKKEIEGFYTARVFYSPDPEKPEVELDKKTAVRNTIYWNPYVHPDKTGNVSVNFYNTKVETKVKVALEGITGGGIPVVKNAYYTIKK